MSRIAVRTTSLPSDRTRERAAGDPRDPRSFPGWCRLAARMFPSLTQARAEEALLEKQLNKADDAAVNEQLADVQRRRQRLARR